MVSNAFQFAVAIISTLILALFSRGTACSSAPVYELIAEWGGSGTEDGHFLQPHGIAIDAERNLFISDPTTHCIQKFTAEGEFLTRWGGYGQEEGRFIAPQGIDVDAAGNVYVADFLNDRIQKFNNDGAFLAAWSTRMEGWWLYSTPRAVAVDGEGYIYVQHAALTPPDRYYTCIQKYNAEGILTDEWPFFWLDAMEMTTDSDNNLYVPATVIGPVQIFSPEGRLVYDIQSCTAGDIFCTTTGIALDHEGNVYVSDALNRCIKKFNRDGTLITGIILQGKYGFAVQPSPYGLAIDNQGNIYVADAANDCIKKYAPVATTTTTIPVCPVVILYGDQAHETKALRLLRDAVLRTTPEGRQLVGIYYHLSPLLVQIIKNDSDNKNVLRPLMDTLLSIN